MPKERITSKIKNVILQGTYGFDVYIAMKTTDNPIKKFILEEGKPETQDGFKSGSVTVLFQQLKKNICQKKVSMHRWKQ